MGLRPLLFPSLKKAGSALFLLDLLPLTGNKKYFQCMIHYLNATSVCVPTIERNVLLKHALHYS